MYEYEILLFSKTDQSFSKIKERNFGVSGLSFRETKVREKNTETMVSGSFQTFFTTAKLTTEKLLCTSE